jgi:hypothetical protein
MGNMNLLKQLSAYKTSQLLVKKVTCTVKIATYKFIEMAGLAVAGSFAAFATPKIFAGQMNWDGPAVFYGLMALYCAMLAIIARINHGHQLGKKELINDLLALRMNQTGKPRPRRFAKKVPVVDKGNKPE